MADICEEGLSDEEIADLIWEYYLRKRIAYVEIGNLTRGIEKEFGLKSFSEISSKSIELLIERGLVKKEHNNFAKCDYLEFYTDSDNIKKNIASYNGFDLRGYENYMLSKEDDFYSKLRRLESQISFDVDLYGEITVSDFTRKHPSFLELFSHRQIDRAFDKLVHEGDIYRNGILYCSKKIHERRGQVDKFTHGK